MTYNTSMEIELFRREIGGGTVRRTERGWRLSLPVGDWPAYRLAQLDDYVVTGRQRFKYVPPWSIRLRARVSPADLPGTWGFGLWNDPFGLSIGYGGRSWRLPSLPQTAWFMHAGPPNWLSLQSNGAPGDGFFAGTFRSPRIASFLFAPGVVALPFLALKPASRGLRRLASRIIRQDGARIDADVTQWHEYRIDWREQECRFSVDGSEVLQTRLPPLPPLGLVIWIDNQFAKWTPEGRIGYGTLPSESAWMEIEGLSLTREVSGP